MKKIIAIAICCTLIGVTNVFAQVEGNVSVQYEMSFATGDLGDFIPAPSFRGISFQYRKAVSDKLLAGFDVGWNIFYEKKDLDTYTLGTISLSGVQYRYQNVIPILISADYFISSDKAMKPYIGIGIGTVYSKRDTDMGTWRLEENPWQFALKPELGVLYEVSMNTLFKLSAKYYSGFKSKDMDGQGFFTISAGFAWYL